MFDRLQDLLSVERMLAVGQGLLRLLAILLAAYVLVRLVRRWVPTWTGKLIQRMSRRAQDDEEASGETQKRAQTLGTLLGTTMIVLIWIVAVIMALEEAGFDVAPILAGAGVLGLAIGFGAQNLVRDVISGTLMLLENQVRVGDVAVVNGTGGLVERISLRTTVLRSLDGTVHVFPNGAITTLSNMTMDFSFYVFDVGVAYKEDTDRVVETLREIGATMQDDPNYRDAILAPLEIMGVDAFGDSAVTIKARFKTKPIQQWSVGREMNRRIKKTFDERGIEIPFPHLSIYFGEASKAFQLAVADGQRGQVRQLVEEILSERLPASSAARPHAKS